MNVEGKDPRTLKIFQYSRKRRTKNLLFRYQDFLHQIIIIKVQCIYYFRDKQIVCYNKMKSHKIDSYLHETLIFDTIYMIVHKRVVVRNHRKRKEIGILHLISPLPSLTI